MIIIDFFTINKYEFDSYTYLLLSQKLQAVILIDLTIIKQLRSCRWLLIFFYLYECSQRIDVTIFLV